MTSDSVHADALFLGLDWSTQSLKATATDIHSAVAYENSVHFDSDLPAYRTRGGVHSHPDGLTVTSPPLLWVEALDLLLERMKADGFPFGQVRAVSGSGQQHGSVWWKKGAAAKLAELDPGQSLRDQLSGCFSVTDSPIWMDSSTGRECRSREEALGGAQAVADLTGSRAYERFTGNQIAKIYRLEPDAYRDTERIALVSSFAASLLAGGHVPIDAADGSGMNLMDLRAKRWAPAALACTAPGLEEKLGPIALSHSTVGLLHRYFPTRYGFPADCRIIVFSGDNPNSLAGLRLQAAGHIAVSLGTSDTLFASLADPHPSGSEGHIFVNPVDPEAYMALVCFKNGSLTREWIRNDFAGSSWDAFNAALETTPPGNAGQIGFYIKEPEITPPLLTTGIFRFDAGDRPVDAFPAEANVRAVVEGQFLSMRLHARKLGIRPALMLATGGASANPHILKIMADVFGVSIYVGDQPGSASLGAAYRALHGWKIAEAGRFVPFADIFETAPAFRTAAEPDPGVRKMYDDLLARYEKLESVLQI